MKTTPESNLHDDTPVFMFDLGGVLIRIQDVEDTASWALEIMSEHDFEHLWTRSPRPVQLERGLLTPREFAILICREYRLDIEVEELLEHFKSIVMEPFPRTREVLELANASGRTVCLSNTNSLHWKKVLEETDVLTYFDLLLPSFEIGLVKPDPEIYRQALRRIPASAENVVFFDDRAENVEGARKLGIRAHQVFGPEDVLPYLGRG
jgi:HAD superfamily hydrolase (TIGR01509 family)